jgi:hypothetical protein
LPVSPQINSLTRIPLIDTDFQGLVGFMAGIGCPAVDVSAISAFYLLNPRSNGFSGSGG